MGNLAEFQVQLQEPYDIVASTNPHTLVTLHYAELDDLPIQTSEKHNKTFVFQLFSTQTYSEFNHMASVSAKPYHNPSEWCWINLICFTVKQWKGFHSLCHGPCDITTLVQVKLCSKINNVSMIYSMWHVQKHDFHNF
jgi:hypothetical protein